MTEEVKSEEKGVVGDDVDFLYEAMYKRDPKKRRVKPVERHLLQLDFGMSDSESDSDFEINEHEEPDSAGSAAEMEDGDDGSSEGDGEFDDEDEEDNDEEGDEDSGREVTDSGSEKKTSIGELITKARLGSSKVTDKTGSGDKPSAKLKMLICAVCLGEVSIDSDEIVECDSCGIGVHEGCYGEILSDSDSTSSVQTASSTEPWFCDTCKAGIANATCELCPNSGGIFKETDAGRWVHVVCALYVPGVAFADVEKLRWVTLSEMPTGKWGVRTCVYCEDERFSRTGICISCDAGMCRNYFHVTCGQREGILSEASPEEDIADPFYAYCKLHVEKSSMRYRRQNYLAIQSQLKRFKERKPDDPISQERITEKLKRWQDKYKASKVKKPSPWVPTEKVPRLLTTSPSAIRHLMKKAELLGINTESQHQTHVKESSDVRRKWHIPPAFTGEFVNYYLDRDVRMSGLKNRLGESMRVNERLQAEQVTLRGLYDKLSSEVESLRISTAKQRMEGQSLWKMLVTMGLKKQPMPEAIKSPRAKKIPTKKEGPKSPAVIHYCGICEQSTDQHQLALCDTCKKHYHLGCLDPPLSRMPKKTAFSGWQCSECVTSSSDTSMAETVEGEDGDEAVRRKRRIIREPNKFTPPVDGKGSQKKLASKGKRKGKRGMKRKLKLAKEEAEDEDGNSVKDENEPPKAKRERSTQRKLPVRETKGTCCKCNKEGDTNSIVRCDQCKKFYHFSCLDPPCKKCPKKFGYMWYCTDCDTGSSTEEECEDHQEQDDEPTTPDNKQPATPDNKQPATPSNKPTKGKSATGNSKTGSPGKSSPASTKISPNGENKGSPDGNKANMGASTCSPNGNKLNPNGNKSSPNGNKPSPNGNKPSPNRNKARKGNGSPRGSKASPNNKTPNGKKGSPNGTSSPSENKASLAGSKASSGKGKNSPGGRRSSPAGSKENQASDSKSPAANKRSPPKK
ncbi:PHD finger protein 14-like [Patiria miniata]|uniref:PHD finger protein 14 n=1 Tax=Patiria miniata TaxID=46514 RepID=A0A914BSQ9_PATMI|nr:PHD finger protein 14-like [Patiria miniata]